MRMSCFIDGEEYGVFGLGVLFFFFLRYLFCIFIYNFVLLFVVFYGIVFLSVV